MGILEVRSRLSAALLAAVIVLFGGVATASAQTVTATWDRNTDSYTAGYRLYYGTASGSYQWSVDAGNQTSAPVNLSPGNVYYFAVRGYNSQYQYGPPSAEAVVDLRSSGSTAPTAQITATLGANNVATVNWQTTNATSASINGTAVSPSGSATVTVTSPTTFTLTARSASGVTATASASVTPGATQAPAAPGSLTAAVNGNRATLRWQAPTAGAAPTSYVLDVGRSPGGSDVASNANVGNVLSVYGDLDRGTYYARVKAANGAGVSASSNEVRFSIGKKLRTPTGLRVVWSGTTATLSWTASAADAADEVPSHYVIEAGTTPGASNVGAANVGNVTSFRAEVTSGSYYVRVRAQNAHGESDPSDEIEVRAPGTPQAPTALFAVGTSGNVDLRWTASAGGYPPIGYILEAGTAPGRVDLGSLPVGNVTRFTTPAPPGVYYVRVRAVNDRGASLPSNEIVVRR